MDILKKIKSNYIIILQFSVWLISLFSPFLLVINLDEEITNWIKFSYFFLAGIVGLSLIGIKRFSARKFAGRWLIITILLFLSCIALYGYYDFMYRSKIVEIAQGSGKSLVLVTGDNYLPEVQKDIESYKKESDSELSKEEVLQLFTDRFPDIILHPSDISKRFWPEDQINSNRYKLIALHYGLLACLSLFIISLLQTLKCYRISLS